MTQIDFDNFTFYSYTCTHFTEHHYFAKRSLSSLGHIGITQMLKHSVMRTLGKVTFSIQIFFTIFEKG